MNDVQGGVECSPYPKSRQAWKSFYITKHPVRVFILFIYLLFLF